MSQYYGFNWISNEINAALEDKTLNLTDFKCLNVINSQTAQLPTDLY